MNNKINNAQNEEKKLLEEIFFNKLKLINNQKEKNFDSFLEKTYIRIKLKKLSLIDNTNLFFKKLEKFENYKKNLKNLAKEREDLKIKLINNLKTINEKLKELYSLMLMEEKDKPVIIEEKINKVANKDERNSIELLNNHIKEKSNVSNTNINNINSSKKTAAFNQNNLEELDEEKILKKLEEELKNLEKELQIATM